MPWAEITGISVLSDHAIAVDGEALAAAVHDVVAEYAELDPP